MWEYGNDDCLMVEDGFTPLQEEAPVLPSLSRGGKGWGWGMAYPSRLILQALLPAATYIDDRIIELPMSHETTD